MPVRTSAIFYRRGVSNTFKDLVRSLLEIIL